jgi:hypothetical protein
MGEPSHAQDLLAISDTTAEAGDPISRKVNLTAAQRINVGITYIIGRSLRKSSFKSTGKMMV